MPRQHFVHKCRGGLRIEHQIDLRIGIGIIGKGIVQQMVENLSIERASLGQITAEVCAGWRPPAIAAAHCQPSEFCGRIGHRVGLAVVENLQPMFDHSQERVGALQNLSLLIGKHVHLGQSADSLKRVTAAHAWSITAVEKLQELNREFNVTNSAAARLEVGSIAAIAVSPLLDASLDRLDATDVGASQPATVNPRL